MVLKQTTGRIALKKRKLQTQYGRNDRNVQECRGRQRFCQHSALASPSKDNIWLGHGAWRTVPIDNIQLHLRHWGLSSMCLIRFRYSGVKMFEPESSKPPKPQSISTACKQKAGRCLRPHMAVDSPRHRAIPRGIYQPDEEMRLCALLAKRGFSHSPSQSP